METIGDRLLIARESAHERLGRTHKVTQSELGLNMGITQGAIYKIETNQRKRGEIDVIKLMKAAEFLNCSFLWLATGEGTINSNDQQLLESIDHGNRCPLFRPDNLGGDSITTMEIPDTLSVHSSSDIFYTIIADEGMNPAASAGDIVLVDPAASVRVGDWVLASIPDRHLPVVRRIIERTTEQGHGYSLQTLNAEFAERPLKKISDLLGVVREVRCYPRRSDGYSKYIDAATSSNVVRLPV